MTEYIDHAAEARRLAELGDASYGFIEHRNGASGVSVGVEALLIAQVAQVHATLALAEQQRIANLIAMGSLQLVMNEKAQERVSAEIREGLGLS